MKYFAALGGFLGCSLAFSSAIFAGNGPGYALRTGAIGCLAGAALLAVFHIALVSCARSTIAEKARARSSAPETPARPGQAAKNTPRT